MFWSLSNPAVALPPPTLAMYQPLQTSEKLGCDESQLLALEFSWSTFFSNSVPRVFA